METGNTPAGSPAPDVEGLREERAETLEKLAALLRSTGLKDLTFDHRQSQDETGEYETRKAELKSNGGKLFCDLLDHTRGEWDCEAFELICLAVNALPALLAIAEENGRLRDELAQEDDAHNATSFRLARLEAEAAALRGALEPFANLAVLLDNGPSLGLSKRLPDDAAFMRSDEEVVISMGDFRRARSALNPTRGNGNG